MKPLKRIIVLLSITVCAAPSLLSQANEDISMKSIFRNALVYLQSVEQQNCEVVRMEFDILKEPKSTLRLLQGGWNYGIIAFGDYRIHDIDIAVYKDINGKWVLVQKDNDPSAYAAVNITPSTSGLYRIDIIGYRFAPGYDVGHYGLLVFHE